MLILFLELIIVIILEYLVKYFNAKGSRLRY